MIFKFMSTDRHIDRAKMAPERDPASPQATGFASAGAAYFEAEGRSHAPRSNTTTAALPYVVRAISR